MNSQDAHIIIALAALAASADGTLADEERLSIVAAAERLGVPGDDPYMSDVLEGTSDVTQLARALSSDEARVAAYDVAAAVCRADGPPNATESAFLSALSRALGAGEPLTAWDAQEGAETPEVGAARTGQSVARQPVATSSVAADAFILDQAMLAGAAELLPGRASRLAVLSLQLHMVYTIGQRHGQALNMAQVKDLVAVLGIGAAGRLVEGVVRDVLGGAGRGLIGGLLGTATGAAAGVAVTFATTYALGHVAERYYAQGRRLSSADLRALFARLQGDARTVYPRVEGRIRELAASNDLSSMLGGTTR